MSRSGSVLIVIATYNRANLLPQALDSALFQDFPCKKIAVIDDGSTDETKEICRRYEHRYPEIVQFLHKVNGGCSSARNLGIELIDDTIAYVCFLDSDDRLLPGKLSREVRQLEAHPEADFTYGDCIIFQEETGQERLQAVAAAGRSENFPVEHFLTNEAKCSAILYRAAILKNRRFPTKLRYNEDSEFLQRIALDHKGIYCPEPGCWVRSHPGSKSRNLLGIARSVYLASRDILIDYPEFHAAHRTTLDQRMKQIRKNLFAELAAVGEWGEASEHAVSFWEKFVVSARLSVVYCLRKWAIHQLKIVLRTVRGYTK